jgi:aspartyl-tRNA(Asn)/glutamyl-tRNA(Gln) amidotransferase subunit C
VPNRHTVVRVTFDPQPGDKRDNALVGLRESVCPTGRDGHHGRESLSGAHQAGFRDDIRCIREAYPTITLCALLDFLFRGRPGRPARIYAIATRNGIETLSLPDTLSAEDVRYVAQLTHLALTDEEVESLRTQLSAVLAHFQTLQQIDTDGVEPTGHSTDVNTVMRDDEPGASLPRPDVLANAPGIEDDYVRVLPVLGQ